MDQGQLDFFIGLTQSIGQYGLSIEVFWMLLIALVVGFLLHRSLFGFRLMAIGGNPEAGKLARLPVKRYKVLAFILCSILAAIAGILDFSFIQTSQPDIGLSQTFPVFAAVIIGGASLSGGKGTIIGTLGGALLLAELQIGLALLSPGPHVQQIFLGAVTIGAVSLDLFLTSLRKRRSMSVGRDSGISLRGVTKSYGNTIALNGVDLEIVPGEVLGIAGPNGAGKSTLVRIIGGEERPSAGTLTFDGQAMVADRRLARSGHRASGTAALSQSDRRAERRRRTRGQRHAMAEARGRRRGRHGCARPRRRGVRRCLAIARWRRSSAPRSRERSPAMHGCSCSMSPTRR